MKTALIVISALGLLVGCTRIPPGPPPPESDGGAGCGCAGDRECGDDGCGNSCGSCLGGTSCNASGRCVAGCVPDCRDRTCGLDPVCGMPCGSASCDDGNVCTTDSCTSGRCTHQNVGGEYACTAEGNVYVCVGGTSTEQTCGRRARETQGVNGTFGCEDGRCRNVPYPDRPTCAQGDSACVMDEEGGRFIGVCLTDETGATYWYFGTCTRACIEGGFTSWTGRCEANSEGREICICT